jgi:hypothetical protein
MVFFVGFLAWGRRIGLGRALSHTTCFVARSYNGQHIDLAQLSSAQLWLSFLTGDRNGWG